MALTITIKRIPLSSRDPLISPPLRSFLSPVMADRKPKAGFYTVVEQQNGKSTGEGKIFSARVQITRSRLAIPDGKYRYSAVTKTGRKRQPLPTTSAASSNIKAPPSQVAPHSSPATGSLEVDLAAPCLDRTADALAFQAAFFRAQGWLGRAPGFLGFSGAANQLGQTL